MPDKPRRRWFRFSLRTLLVAVAILMIGCYWCARPTFIARQFVQAVKQRDLAKAEALFKDDDDGHAFSGAFATAEQLEGTKITIEPMTFDDLINGTRHVNIDVPYGKGMFDFDWHLRVVAARHGLSLIWVYH